MGKVVLAGGLVAGERWLVLVVGARCTICQKILFIFFGRWPKERIVLSESSSDCLNKWQSSCTKAGQEQTDLGAIL